MVPFNVPNVEPASTQRDYGQDLSAWAMLVQDYSKRRLSYSDMDKLPAIAGIAETFAHLLKDEYNAGIFKRTLSKALLWLHADTRLQAAPSASREYRCPSWSWANTNHPVKLHADLSDLLDVRDVAEVVIIDVELDDPSNPFGRLLSARLELRCWLVPFQWDAPDVIEREREYDPSDMWNPPISTSNLKHSLFASHITFNYIKYRYEVRETNYVVLVEYHGGSEQTKGLIVHKIIREGQNVYIRVGTARVSVKGLSAVGTVLRLHEIFEHYGKLPKETIVLV
jgi:hypothetical protein